MGLLLSVLVTCVGVLEVIACYTHFRVGIAYNECKSNIRDIAKYYAVELRKHDLQFEPGPSNGSANTESPHTESLSELIRPKSSVRVQEKPEHWDNGYTPSSTDLLQPSPSCSHTPGTSTPNQTTLMAPRNSVCGVDTPTLAELCAANINIPEVVADTIQEHVNDEQFWTRKSLSVLDKSRSPSPFPEAKPSDTGTELIYTPGLRKRRTPSPQMLAEVLVENEQTSPPLENELAPNDLWNKGPTFSVQSDISEPLSETDLEVRRITESIITVTDIDEPVVSPRQPSPYPEPLFGITDDIEETKFDEAFLRSLDGVKSPKCDDRRRSFKKKRNSSSNSSRASRDRSLTSLDEMDMDLAKKPMIDHQIDKHETKENKISPLTEEDSAEMKDNVFTNETTELNGHEVRTETVIPEKCDTLSQSQAVDQNKERVTVSKQEKTLFEASVSPNTSKQDASKEKTDSDKGKANLTFTEKVKDLEISVQLLVTVKGTSQGDKMEYVTSVTQDDQKSKEPSVSITAIEQPKKEECVTKSTEECSEFGKVKTSVTYGNRNVSTPEPTSTDIVQSKEILNKPDDSDVKQNLKDLQISSQSLIHAERTTQDVNNSEAEFLKLYESFTELPNGQKDKFLRIIGQSSKVDENKRDNETPTTNVENTIGNIENVQKEIQLNESEKPVCSKELNENVEEAMNKELLESNSKVTQNQQSESTVNIVSSQDSHTATTNETISNSSADVKDTQSDMTINSKSMSSVPLEVKQIEEVSTNTAVLKKPAAQDNTDGENVEITETQLPAQTSKNDKALTSNDTLSNADAIKRTIETEETKTRIVENKDAKAEIQKDTRADIKTENSSDSSSETPSTVVQNALRRASKTAFEEANVVQNREMMTRRLSNSEISPKQATQAFWVK